MSFDYVPIHSFDLERWIYTYMSIWNHVHSRHDSRQIKYHNVIFICQDVPSLQFQKNSSAKCSFVQLTLLQKKKFFFLIILHRLCIHLTKKSFAEKIAWQMVKRTFYNLWIICTPLNYVWSRIIKKHKNHARITTSSIICK